MNLKICYLKIDVSCEVSVNFISHLTKCHAWHATCTLSPPDADRAIHKKHAKRNVWSDAPATQNDDEDLQSVAPVNSSSENDTNLPQKKQHLMKHVDVEMSQSATPATRNEATRRLKPPKAIAFAELATGTVILLSRRSPADTCERLKAQRTRLKPQTPKVKREPFAAFRNKCKLCCLLDVSGTDRKERNPYCQLARRKNHHYITGTPFKPNKKQFQYSA